MHVQADCRVCNAPKIVTDQGGFVQPASAVAWSGRYIQKVFCDGCGLIYLPESIGCKSMPPELEP